MERRVSGTRQSREKNIAIGLLFVVLVVGLVWEGLNGRVEEGVMEQNILEALSYQVLLLHVLMGHLPRAAEFVPLVVGGPCFYINGLYFWLMRWRVRMV